ncbi:MBL fold metallo-hydrolase [Nitratireductor aquimarinus]|uniref:MBL fold metallo-hydrolase n=1 Tax=Nitratireductor aquimarinus TaxID=889300 RepID=A0ABU4AMW3_9HYPH|nr:MBL fold metallo-hydrolase [Nitratireductor aquimarinus]MDV6227579.1 MBL fold metallo-hydrolase [Nitratireductor aquimarinus]
MLTVDLQGGFGEKGRTSVAVSDGDTRIMLDAGIKVGATGDEYYPVLARPVGDIDALFISHAHEDHIGALCRLIHEGYTGPIYMTAETRTEMPATLAQYADAAELWEFMPKDAQIRLFEPGERLSAGALAIETGASGHVVGGVWFSVEGQGRRVVYSADIVPESAVFPMQPLPSCDLLILDASYGADPIPGTERAQRIAKWVADYADGCLLPTPLSGRSLELIAAIDVPFAIEAGMREALSAQIHAPGAVYEDRVDVLAERLAAARDWNVGEALPACPLLVHDGMGVAGPSRPALAAAELAGYPILLSGHLPKGSPGARLVDQGAAAWIRMPTHPTLPENVALWEAAGRPALIGHSCDAAALDALHQHIPALLTGARTGDTYQIDKETIHAHSDFQ